MSITLLSVFPNNNFTAEAANGESFDNASLDTIIGQLCESNNRQTDLLRLITDGSNRLRNVATATAQALSGSQRFTATASQTTFNTTIAYVAAFTNLNVMVESSGVRIDPNLVTVSNNAGFLRAVIPAQANGTIVVVSAFESGAGISSNLASTSINLGASLIGLYDTGAFWSSTNVEAFTQEIAGLVKGAAGKSYLEGLLVLSGYLLKTGGTMSGAIAMGNQKITGLGAGSAGTNDAARMADITASNLMSILSASLTAAYLPKSGGTMSGAIAMGSQKITALANGTVSGDAINYGQLTAQSGANITSGTVAAARLGVMTGATSVANGASGAVPTPIIGDQAKFLRGDGTFAAPNTVSSGYIIGQEQQTSGTNGGTLTAATWNVRTVNTEVHDTGNHATISAGTITLAAGTYRVRASAVQYFCQRGQLRLQNTTDGVTLCIGICVTDNAVNDVESVTLDMVGRFTITATKTLQLQHWVSATGASSGAGVARAGAAGVNECYSMIEFVRE